MAKRASVHDVFVRCEDVLAGVTCPVSFTGTQSGVVSKAAAHAIDAHGYADNRRLRERIREVAQPSPREEPASRRK
jgi:hypothetical protein